MRRVYLISALVLFSFVEKTRKESTGGEHSQGVLNDNLLGNGSTQHGIPIPIRSPSPRSRSGLTLSFDRVDLLLVVRILSISLTPP
jgi:hypothetical protein